MSNNQQGDSISRRRFLESSAVAGTSVATGSVVATGVAIAEDDEDEEDEPQPDLGNYLRAEEQADEPDVIEVQLDEGDWISTVEWDWHEETAEIHIVTDGNLRITITDSYGATGAGTGTGGGSYTFWMETFRLREEGEYILKVPATRYFGEQAITLVGNFPDNVGLKSGIHGTIVPQRGSRSLAFLSGIGSSLVSGWMMSRKMKKDDEEKIDRVI